MMRSHGQDFYAGHGGNSPEAARVLVDEGFPGPILGRRDHKDAEVTSGGSDEAARALPSLVGSNAPAHWRWKVCRSQKLGTAYHMRMKELDFDIDS
mmetsp:Transcript_48488/g.67380  ORF Transcript_48488/g.67380 Transcript_48488/m.67380 type:complete len:96 (+) Transcript_48488:3-290(+)